MAKVRRSSGGIGCVLKFGIAWAVLLLVALVLVNSYLHPWAAPQLGSRGASPEDHDRKADVPSEVGPGEAVSVPPAAPPQPPHQPQQPLLRKGAGKGLSALASASTSVVARDGGDLEDNCPRPPPRDKDSEVASLVTGVLPDADNDHMHGRLMAAVTGELAHPTPLPKGGLNREQKREAHKGQCFNAAKSDSLPLDRDAPDRRSSACNVLHARYRSNGPLPSASIVMVFHNEIASVLLRGVHSVLNHSPPDLLVEIILVDDASVPDPTRFSEERWNRLHEPLVEYIKQLPKVRLVQLGERRGLMLARMEGAWRATGEVVVFLDSHIEATAGWLEPLLARIREDRKHVVVPSIDSIEFDNFGYEGNSGLGVLGFSWTLGQRPEALPRGDPSKPFKSPIMAGGLFAAHRAYFLHLGGYDDGMRFYGGEEMEIGFRTWQCGGDIEFIPCSHVFHVFRNSVYWQGTDSGGVAYKVPGMDITRNKLRTAAVWMDEYAKLVEYASPPLNNGFNLGDLEKRHELRRKLQCKPFKWYLEHVVPKMYAPDATNLRAGALKNDKLNGCVDTMGGDQPGLYPCHGQHGTQGLVMDGEGLVRVPILMYEQCMTVQGSSIPRKLVLRPCPHSMHHSRDDLRWTLDATTGAFSVHLDGSGDRWCLEAMSKGTSKSPVDVHVMPCTPEVGPMQRWEWMTW
mmetsp:Transcript_139264/g.445164  ORF Transcript_139264/g.445164 Transcript_139264/m.445164 type:complete len:685 (-) Transcript_139264:134-2188(-)